jgi:hypothetical protein
MWKATACSAKWIFGINTALAHEPRKPRKTFIDMSCLRTF